VLAENTKPQSHILESLGINLKIVIILTGI